jgi:flavin-dependent dehydrogenase
MPEYVSVLIVGGGPAGTACALDLSKSSERGASGIVLIDKATFPRFKPCGGGLTNSAMRHLSALGVRVERIPNIIVSQIQFTFPGHARSFTYREVPLLHMVSRRDLDDLLLNEVKERGISVREGERLLSLVATRNGVLARTTKQEYIAKIIVAADGAHSRSRAFVDPHQQVAGMWAAEVTTAPRSLIERNAVCFSYGFRCTEAWGYTWDFPWVGSSASERLVGVALIRRPGIEKRGLLATLLESGEFGSFGAATGRTVQGFVPAYSSSRRLAFPRVIFAGDSAGTDALWGAGITSALGMGRIAATSAQNALCLEEYSMRDYERMVKSSRTGRKLRLRRLLATLPPNVVGSASAILIDGLHSKLSPGT